MPVIEVDNLPKRYGDQVAVDGVSFTVETGEIFGILGPNGAGKTTTVECVEGLRTPDRGTVRVLGLDPRRDGPSCGSGSASSSRRASCPTSSRSARRWTCTPPSTTSRRTAAAARRAGTRRQARHPFGKLSGGQKQRLSIALALVGNPEVAVLDELTTGLDPQARRDTWELIEQIRDRGVTVVLVTHFMEEAERLCDRVAVIDAGRLVAIDSPAGLVARVDAEQRIRFRPSAPLDDGCSPTCRRCQVTRRGAQVVVTGTGDLLQAVTAVLRPQPDRRRRPPGRAGQPGRRLRRADRPPARQLTTSTTT